MVRVIAPVILSAVTIWGGVVVASGQAATDYGRVRTPALETRLPTPMPVYCWPYDNSWTNIYAPTDGITLAGWACDMLLNGRPGDINDRLGVSWSTAVFVLYHEWWHQAFVEANEKLTDCGAWAIFPYVLHRYWGLPKATAARLYLQSGYRSSYAPLPCSFTQR